MGFISLPFSTKKETKEILVLELFTSEGCSSCPPADKLLKEIIEDAKQNNKEIYALAFHVDYWDYLGWKDVFASPDYTARQNVYADYFSSQRIYTPQLIVNGTKELVGSDRKTLKGALARPSIPTAFITLTTKMDNGKISLHYILSGDIHEALLNVALVQKGISTKVSAGENVGKTLLHENIVRKFQTLKILNEEGNIILHAKGLPLESCEVIAFIQKEEDWKIVGATAVEL